MKFQCNYNSELNIIESATHGLGSRNEIIDMLRCILDLCIKNDTADIMVDHSDLDPSLMSMDDISKISRSVVEAKDILNKRKCAHIASKDIQFGLVRAWEIMIEIAGVPDFKTKVFREKKDALEWIKSTPNL